MATIQSHLDAHVQSYIPKEVENSKLEIKIFALETNQQTERETQTKKRGKL